MNKKGLSPRQEEIMSLVAQGLFNKEIGGKLGIAEETVKSNLVVIYDKLNARNRPHAVAILAGMV